VCSRGRRRDDPSVRLYRIRKFGAQYAATTCDHAGLAGGRETTTGGLFPYDRDDRGRQAVGHFQKKIFECVAPRETPPLTWRSANNALNPKLYDSLIAKELNAAGFQASKDPDNLFQSKDDDHDLRIAGNIKDINATLCMQLSVNRSPEKPDTIEQYDFEAATGYIYFDIDWQLYSASQKKSYLIKK
jgi:hypothetical protein